MYSQNTVYAGTDNGSLFAVRADGKLKWKFTTGDAIRTTPVFSGDKIIFGSHDHNVYCLNSEGRKLWKFATGGPLWTYPCIVDRKGNVLFSPSKQIADKSNDFIVYFGAFDGGLYCIENDGKFLWKYNTHGANTSGPEYDNGTIYFGSTDGNLYCVNSKTRNLLWKFSTIGKIGHSCPVVNYNEIFICDYVVNSTSTGGNLYCLDKNGKLKWRFSVDNAIVSTPLVIGDILYVGSYDGFLYAISISKKELLWKFRTLYEKLNFDINKSASRMEAEEVKTKNVFSLWKSELSQPAKNTYEQNFNENSTIYSSTKDINRFTYSKREIYKRKNMYEERDTQYK